MTGVMPAGGTRPERELNRCSFEPSSFPIERNEANVFRADLAFKFEVCKKVSELLASFRGRQGLGIPLVFLLVVATW